MGERSANANLGRGPVGVALLLLLLLVSRATLFGAVAPFDSTFQSARVVEHLHEGVGAQANPGVGTPQPLHPVASPLATLFAAVPTWFGMPTLGTVLWLPILCELGAAALLLRLLWERWSLAVLSVVLLAAAPEAAFVTAGGGGGPIALLFVLATCLAARGPGNARAVTAGFCAGLATIAAPEAALVLPGVWMAWRRTLGRIALEGLGFGLVLVPAILAMQSLFGTWRPAPLLEGPPLWGPPPPGLAACVLLPLAVLGLRRTSDATTVGLRPLLLVGVLAGVPWALCGASLAPRAGYLPLVGLLPIAALGAEPIVHRLLLRAPSFGLAVAASVLVVAGWWAVPREGRELSEHVWGPLEAWASDAGVGTVDAQLLASEVGMVGWFTGAVVRPAATTEEDLETQLSSLERLADLHELHGEGELPVRYLLIPTGRRQLSALRSSGELARAWYPIQRFSVTGDTGLEPHLSAIPEQAVGDYLLFRRRP